MKTTTTTETTVSIAGQASQAANEFIDNANQAIENNEIVKEAKSWLSEETVAKLWEYLPSVIIAVLTIVLGYFFAKFISKVVVKTMEAKGTDPSIFRFIQTMIKVMIMTMVVASALSSLGFDLSGITAALASAGVAIGLGLQNCVSQFISGIMIIFNKPFKKNDFIEIKGVSGCVSDIHIMYTEILTADNKKIIMPNSDLTANHIINYSAQDKRRCDLTFGISYSDDIGKAKAIILSIVEKDEAAIKDPAPVVFVCAQEASSVQLSLRCWCLTDNYWDLYFRLQENVKLAFDANDISIPFNQIDVHIVEK